MLQLEGNFLTFWNLYNVKLSIITLVGEKGKMKIIHIKCASSYYMDPDNQPYFIYLLLEANSLQFSI